MPQDDYQTIDIPGVGQVQFPKSMSDEDISNTIRYKILAPKPPGPAKPPLPPALMSDAERQKKEGPGPSIGPVLGGLLSPFGGNPAQTAISTIGAAQYIGDLEKRGAGQTARGVERIAGAKMPAVPGEAPTTPGREIAGGFSDVVRGTGKMAAPAAIPLALMNPVSSAVAVGYGALAGLGAEKAAQKLWPDAPEYAAAASDAANIIAGAFGPKVTTALLSRMKVNPSSAVAELAKFADDHNIPLSGAARTAIDRLRKFQTRTAGTKVAEQSRAATQEGLARTGEELQRTGGKTGDIETREVAGGGVAAKLGAAEQRASKGADVAYTRLRDIEEASQKPVTVGTRRVESPLIDPATGKPGFRDEPITETVGLPVDMSTAKVRLANIVKPIEAGMPLAQRQASAGLQALHNIIDGPDTMSATTADGYLGAVKQILREPGISGRNRYLLRQALDEMEPTVDRAVAQGGPEATEALAEGRALTRAKYAAQGTMRRLGMPKTDDFPLEPLKLFRKLTMPGDANVGLLRRVQAQAPDSIPAVGRAYLEGLFDSALGRDGEKLNTAAALKAWTGMGDASKKILFQPDQIAALDRFFRLVNQVDRMTPTSAPATSLTHKILEGAAAVLPEAAGSLLGHPGWTEAGLIYGAGRGLWALGARTVSKALWNPETARMLTEGISSPSAVTSGAAAVAAEGAKGQAQPTKSPPSPNRVPTAVPPLTAPPRASVSPVQFAPMFTETGRRVGVAPGLLRAMATAESNNDPQALSPKGAQGLMQIMPDTARDLGIDPYNPRDAIDGAARYMRQLLAHYDGNLHWALAAYNAGMGTVDKWREQGKDIQYKETRDYVYRVLASLQPPGSAGEPPPAGGN